MEFHMQVWLLADYMPLCRKEDVTDCTHQTQSVLCSHPVFLAVCL